jgi:AraC-like DNA-binding protein
MITAAITSVRIGRARGRRVAESGASGLRFPASPSVGFHVMLSGEGWLITQDAEPAPVRPGDIVFTAAGAEHGIAQLPCRLAALPQAVMADMPPPPVPVDFEFLCGAYHVEPAQLPQFLRHLPSVFAFTPDYERYPQLGAVVEMLRADFTDPGPGSDANRAALIDLMIVHILRHLQERGESWPLTDEPGVTEALREIHDRPQRPWSVQQLSEVAGMSRTAFTRRFTAAVGMPPMSYLIDWRLTAGARLLQQSDAPLSAIARKVGYSTEFAFAAAFRRKYSVAPGRYRATVTDQAIR